MQICIKWLITEEELTGITENWKIENIVKIYIYIFLVNVVNKNSILRITLLFLNYIFITFAFVSLVPVHMQWNM